MSDCRSDPGADEAFEVCRLVAGRLAGFLRTLRDNGFAIGLQEASDAAAVMASGYVARPGWLKSALKQLLSARKADWDRFDGLFDAFWLGRRVRSRSLTVNSARTGHSPSLKSLQHRPDESTGGDAATDQIPSAGDAPATDGSEGRM